MGYFDQSLGRFNQEWVINLLTEVVVIIHIRFE